MAAQASHALPGAPAREAIHVFGTDLAGRHDLPSAAFAVRSHGATPGQASGASGNSFAIPFRDSDCELLPLKQVANYVRDLLKYAAARPQETFQITRFACGEDAYEEAKLAVLFATVTNNCQLPGVWHRCLDRKLPARVLVFDPAARLRDGAWRERVRQYFELNMPVWQVPTVEVVSVGAARSVVANDALARSLGLKHRIMGANDAYFGRDAVLAAEAKAVWYATHFLLLDDYDQTALPAQIRLTATAAAGGLCLAQLDFNAEP